MSVVDEESEPFLRR
ncbi:Protein of unknown function [Bacillus wiedmannii]|uniref:Uncharacterized protein n=1 Tax=Bacillus wiedmannii TaxID=1890302 RepID=A0AB37YLT3_9BACI|nr:Protein of unknown function [Bacillus wiedmannii]